MAKFQDVMRQWRRMCNSSTSTCDDCPLRDYAFMGDKSCDAIYTDWAGNMDNKDWEMLEHAVMSWAAENPEPVYPTWREWLVEAGVIKEEHSDYDVGLLIRTKRIPNDIVQKLCVKPIKPSHTCGPDYCDIE